MLGNNDNVLRGACSGTGSLEPSLYGSRDLNQLNIRVADAETQNETTTTTTTTTTPWDVSHVESATFGGPKFGIALFCYERHGKRVDIVH